MVDSPRHVSKALRGRSDRVIEGIYRATQRADAESWLVKLTTRRNKNIAAVALAHKNARTIWALLAHDREFRADYAPA